MVKDTLYADMYSDYLKGLSLSGVGAKYGMTRQSVYIGFKRRGYVLRPKNERPYQIYDGIKFTLRNNGYYAATTGKRLQMHRYIYEKYNGKIPEGYDIHHKDRDRSNNDITNLELLTKSEHARRYSTGSNQHVKKPYKESI